MTLPHHSLSLTLSYTHTYSSYLCLRTALPCSPLHRYLLQHAICITSVTPDPWYPRSSSHIGTKDPISITFRIRESGVQIAALVNQGQVMQSVWISVPSVKWDLKHLPHTVAVRTKWDYGCQTWLHIRITKELLQLPTHRPHIMDQPSEFWAR